MRFLFLSFLAALVSQSPAAETPTIFAGLLKPDTPVKGQIGMVVPPKEIDPYVAKVEAGARKNPEWFREYAKKSKPGVPLPFHENLGISKEEYDAYLKFWNQREFKPIEEVALLLRKTSGGSWTITSTGGASAISTLRYDPESDSFRSPNGEMKRINDISASAEGILGAWTGKEWKFEEETSLGKTKENFAIGQMTGKNYGLLVYRVQELSSEGTRLLDKSLVIRFPKAKSSK
jgi:hypothetical protein